MSQARTLTSKDLRRVLDHVATRPQAARNRLMVLMTHWAGMRIGEVAALRVTDVISTDGTAKPEIRLAPEQTKGKHARTVFVSERLRIAQPEVWKLTSRGVNGLGLPSDIGLR